MITYDALKTKPKEFLAVTSLTHEEFVHLLPAFARLLQQQTAQLTTQGKQRKRQPGAGTKGKLDRIENKLLFILAYQKGYELQTLLGLHFGLSQPQANYWIHRLLPLLQEALVASAPDQYFRPPYVGHRGWLGVYLDVPVDWAEIAEIVTDAYRMIAPKGLVALLD